MATQLELYDPASIFGETSTAAKVEAAGRRFKLTSRELEVLTQLATGDTRATVAARLGISVHTVDFHLRRAYRKLGSHVAARAMVILLAF